VRHVLRVVREALYFRPEGKGTDISHALEYLNRVTKRKTITFIISDFFDEDYQRLLSISNRRHDIVAVTVTDPRELRLPDVGIVKLEDAETQKDFLVDTSDSSYREKYEREAMERIKNRDRLLRQSNVDSIALRTDVPYEKELVKFFRMRERRLR